jgi:hypothetical protein
MMMSAARTWRREGDMGDDDRGGVFDAKDKWGI